MLNWVREPGIRVDYGAGNSYEYVGTPLNDGQYAAISPNEIIRLHDGSYRMYCHAYFDWSDPTNPPFDPEIEPYLSVPQNLIVSAISSDLLNWTVEPGVRFDVKRGTDWETNVMFPKIVPIPGGYRALFSSWNWGWLSSNPNPYGTFWLKTAISADGLNWVYEPGRKTDENPTTRIIHRTYPSNIVTTENGLYRIYLVTRSEAYLPPDYDFIVRSAVSADGIGWTVEPGIRCWITAANDTAYRLYAVKLEGESVRLFFGCHVIGLNSAFSNDGLNFVRDNGRRISPSIGNNVVSDPVVVRIPGGYRLFHGCGNLGTYPAFNTKVYSAVAYE